MRHHTTSGGAFLNPAAFQIGAVAHENDGATDDERGEQQVDPVARPVPLPAGEQPGALAQAEGLDAVRRGGDQLGPGLAVQRRISVRGRRMHGVPGVGLEPDRAHVIGHPRRQAVRRETGRRGLRCDDIHVGDLDGAQSAARVDESDVGPAGIRDDLQAGRPATQQRGDRDPVGWQVDVSGVARAQA